MMLTGTTTLVTGASSGIGAAVALDIASKHGRVVLTGRNQERLSALAARLPSGALAGILPADLASPGQAEGLVPRIVSSCGPLTGLVHAAGLYKLAPLRALSGEDIDELYRVNVSAALLLTKALRKPGNNRGGDVRVVLISSVAGLTGQGGLSAYSATKGALIAMVRALAVELAREGVRVNCVAPGMVRTPLQESAFAAMTPDQAKRIEDLHPLGIGRAEDVANAVSFLLCPASAWITGTTIVADGGYSAA